MLQCDGSGWIDGCVQYGSLQTFLLFEILHNSKRRSINTLIDQKDIGRYSAPFLIETENCCLIMTQNSISKHSISYLILKHKRYPLKIQGKKNIYFITIKQYYSEIFSTCNGSKHIKGIMIIKKRQIYQLWVELNIQ